MSFKLLQCFQQFLLCFGFSGLLTTVRGKTKNTTSLECLKWHIILREAQMYSGTHPHPFVPLVSFTLPVLSISFQNLGNFLHDYWKWKIYHHLECESVQMYSVCATVHMPKHHRTSLFFFVTVLSSPHRLFSGISLLPSKIKRRNVHGLQRREAGGPFKSSPPVQAGSLKKESPEKGMAVGEHQVNKTNWEIPWIAYLS